MLKFLMPFPPPITHFVFVGCTPPSRLRVNGHTICTGHTHFPDKPYRPPLFVRIVRLSPQCKARCLCIFDRCVPSLSVSAVIDRPTTYLTVNADAGVIACSAASTATHRTSRGRCAPSPANASATSASKGERLRFGLCSSAFACHQSTSACGVVGVPFRGHGGPARTRTRADPEGSSII